MGDAMTTFTGIVASLVVHSSAAALSHFGLSLEPVRAGPAPPRLERVVARSRPAAQKLADCPDGRVRARPIRT
jgi:hypothetical protein